MFRCGNDVFLEWWTLDIGSLVLAENKTDGLRFVGYPLSWSISNNNSSKSLAYVQK